MYKIQQRFKGSKRWEDEKFLTGQAYYNTYKEAQQVKKKLQSMTSSIIYKVVNTKKR